jgi:hypothetical protein
LIEATNFSICACNDSAMPDLTYSVARKNLIDFYYYPNL